MIVNPATIGLAIGGVSSGIQALSRLFPSKYQRENKEKIAELEALLESGQAGLTGEERAILENAYLDPVRSQALANRQRSEAILASQGLSGGADLSRVRQEEARLNAGASQSANAAIAERNLARKAQQQNELEQRKALNEASRKEREASFWNSFNQAAQAGANYAALAPFYKQAGVLPMQQSASATTQRMRELGLTDSEISIVESLANDPDILAEITALGL